MTVNIAQQEGNTDIAMPIAPGRIETLKPVLLQLERHEKLWLIQFLAVELAKQEAPLLSAHASYPVWSPLEAYSAANALLQVLAHPQTEVRG